MTTKFDPSHNRVLESSLTTSCLMKTLLGVFTGTVLELALSGGFFCAPRLLGKGSRVGEMPVGKKGYGEKEITLGRFDYILLYWLFYWYTIDGRCFSHCSLYDSTKGRVGLPSLDLHERVLPKAIPSKGNTKKQIAPNLVTHHDIFSSHKRLRFSSSFQKRVPSKHSRYAFNERNLRHGDTSGPALGWNDFPKSPYRPIICFDRFRCRGRASGVRHISAPIHRAKGCRSIRVSRGISWKKLDYCYLD